MSCKFKYVVNFIKILASLLLSRSFGNKNTSNYNNKNNNINNYNYYNFVVE